MNVQSPSQNRAPLADITFSSLNATPRPSVGSKRSAPSPFYRPQSKPINSTHNKRRYNIENSGVNSSSTVERNIQERSQSPLTTPSRRTSHNSIFSARKGAMTDKRQRETVAELWREICDIPSPMELKNQQIDELQSTIEFANVEKRMLGY